MLGVPEGTMSLCLNRNNFANSMDCMQTEHDKCDPSQIYTSLHPKSSLVGGKTPVKQLTMLMAIPPNQMQHQPEASHLMDKVERRKQVPEGDYFIPASFIFSDSGYTQLSPSPILAHSHQHVKRPGTVIGITPTPNSLEADEI